MLQQVLPVFANDLHLLAQFNDGIQLLGICTLDELALVVDQFGINFGLLLGAGLVGFLLQPCLQSTLTLLDELRLKIVLKAAHLAECVVPGPENLDLLTKLLVLGSEAELVVTDLANKQVQLQQNILILTKENKSGCFSQDTKKRVVHFFGSFGITAVSFLLRYPKVVSLF